MPTIDINRVTESIKTHLPAVFRQETKKIVINYDDFDVSIYWAGVIIRIDIKPKITAVTLTDVR